ncbi:hypothetical protein ACM46_21870 [Chryseobacterium angstadtii]|uniref:Lipocalin-like domain-containing protein n=1 Tax=Chryseobacterium angstadtii TaxID=558151 RepID=A0A0J7KMY4_9FLAO|nr:hypothetical protein [Chryseobacterium angstadtii]KMQ58670.1 hypothetical protein ACM46_21870 [Chryseobacterium angstadtii]
MKKSAYLFLFIFFTATLFKSQTKVDSSFLINTWKLVKIDQLTYIFKSQENFDQKWGGIRFKKNGKFVSSNAKPACGTTIIEKLQSNQLKLYRNRGTWKIDSDTTIIITSPKLLALKGKFIISQLPDKSLSLKRFIKIVKK